MKKLLLLIFTCLILIGCDRQKENPKSENKETEQANIESEQSFSEKPIEPAPELIEKFEYEYDENNSVIIGIFKEVESEKYMLYYSGTYTAENIGIMQDNFLILKAYSILKEFKLYFNATIGDDFFNYAGTGMEVTIDEIPINPLEDIPENYIDKFNEMREKMDDFLAKYKMRD